MQGRWQGNVEISTVCGHDFGLGELYNVLGERGCVDKRWKKWKKWIKLEKSSAYNCIGKWQYLEIVSRK